jgi:hypothetical protein
MRSGLSNPTGELRVPAGQEGGTLHRVEAPKHRAGCPPVARGCTEVITGDLVRGRGFVYSEYNYQFFLVLSAKVSVFSKEKLRISGERIKEIWAM